MMCEHQPEILDMAKMAVNRSRGIPDHVVHRSAEEIDVGPNFRFPSFIEFRHSHPFELFGHMIVFFIACKFAQSRGHVFEGTLARGSMVL